MEIIEVRNTVGKNRIAGTSDSVFGVILQILGDHSIVVIGEGATVNGSLGATDIVQSDTSYFSVSFQEPR